MWRVENCSKENVMRETTILTLGMKTRVLLQVEGAAFLALTVFLCLWFGGAWGMFAVLFWVPDVSMGGFLVIARVGGGVYNAVHTYSGPVLLALYAAWADRHVVVLVAPC